MPESQIYVSDYVKPERIHHTSRRGTVKPGNPTPLGLSTFAICMMVSGLYNFNAFDIKEPNVMVGVCLFTGGIVQFGAGMWEYKVGNTFGGTGFSAFGGFWASLAVIFIPGFGIREAFIDNNNHLDQTQFYNAMGVYSLAWLIFSCIFTLACLRTSMGVLLAFIFLDLTYLNEAIFYFTATTTFIKIAGVFGMLTSAAAWYCFAATILTPDLSPISLPLWDLSHKAD